jgi:uncharacterized protein (DUF1697 family)
MTIAISLLRGVNVVGHNKIKMEELRTLCESIGLLDAQTYIQSGNVVFRVKGRVGIATLTARIEEAIEARFGFRPHVMLRTSEQLRDVVTRNPFAKRTNLDPSRFLVYFLKSEPAREACDRADAVQTDTEELRVSGSEMYIYYLNGVGKSKLPMGRIEKALGTSGTGRNWNTVMKLLEMAEALKAL